MLTVFLLISAGTAFTYLGAFCFGTVIGWITKDVLTRAKEIGISHLAAIIGAVGGAAVTAIFKTESLFAAYCVGLAAGFFMHVLLTQPELYEEPKRRRKPVVPKEAVEKKANEV